MANRPGRGQRVPAALGHRGHDQHRGDLRPDGQGQQRAAGQRPAQPAPPGQHQQRRRGKEGGQHVHVRVVARLQGHGRAPCPEHGQPPVQAQPAQAEQQRRGQPDRADGGGGLDRGGARAGRGDQVDQVEVGLRHRRVDGVHDRPVDQGAARVGQAVRRAVQLGAPGHAPGGDVVRPQEPVAEEGQLRRGRRVGVRVDAGRLDPAVPDVAVQVVAALRRRGQRGQLHRDPAEQDHRRGPADLDAADQQHASGERGPQHRGQRDHAGRRGEPVRVHAEEYQHGEQCRHGRRRAKADLRRHTRHAFHAASQPSATAQLRAGRNQSLRPSALGQA